MNRTRLALLAIGWVVGVAEGADRMLPEGKWGGKGARLEVTAKGAEVELDCAHGTIDAPLVLNADGAFDVKGKLVLERPGPAFESGPDQGLAVRYKGTLEGDTLSLTIVRDDASAKPLSNVKATRGGDAKLTKCL